MNPYSEPQVTSLPFPQELVHSHGPSLPCPDPNPCPDLECAICFSQFNNLFRCPKILQCKHTFCLECLARINVKSSLPDAIQCPLCRGLTALPVLGLPKLATDGNVFSNLPATMQRVYSIRFNRNKGKLQVKRSSEDRVTHLRTVSHTLDVGLPSRNGQSEMEEGREERRTGLGGLLLRLTARPVCRGILMALVVLMMLLLTGVIIFVVTFRPV
ncbi:uncharacterized protein FYW47_007597 [Aplochiton taeniatus]